MKKKILEKKSMKKLSSIENIKSSSINKDSKWKMKNPLKPKGLFDIRGIFSFIKTRLKPDKAMLIKMELENGFHTQFAGFVKDGKFTYKGKTYIIEDEFKYYDLSVQMWCLDYHESLSIPIKRDINATEIKRQLVGSGISEVDRAINPKTLEQFIESQVIEKVMKGQELDNIFRFIKIMLIITAIASVLHLMLFLQKTGMLQQMNIPFL